MKKLKKLFAVMLSLIMVLAMGITSFADEAAPTATIAVNGLDENATVTYKQIIRPNTSTATGWEFVNKEDIALFGDYDEQTVIWKLIKMESGDTKVTNMPEDTQAFATSDYQTALANIATSTSPDETAYNRTAGTCAWNVDSAGVYVINATSTGNYSYNTMAAYISFGSYDITTGVPATLVNADVTAKSTTVDIAKEDNEEDKVVEVGKTVTYNVTTKMPFVSANDPISKYELVDTITGAKYVTEPADSVNAGKVHVTGTVGTTPIDQYVDVVKNSEGKDTITVKLTDYLRNNGHANQTVAITYKATVTELEVNNSVIPADSKHEFTPATDRLYTGTVTLTKTGENGVKLAKAKFVLKKTLADDTEKYALVTGTNSVYTVTDWADSLDTAKVESNLMVTNTDGTITVKGLDDSTEYVTYEFVEIVAPDGYSINETDADVSWATEGDGREAANRTGTASMKDTKLSALPETGGIGTTIFTIVGCGIMIAATGLFFASRRKENR